MRDLSLAGQPMFICNYTRKPCACSSNWGSKPVPQRYSFYWSTFRLISAVQVPEFHLAERVIG
jgi:hypothetical protein